MPHTRPGFLQFCQEFLIGTLACVVVGLAPVCAGAAAADQVNAIELKAAFTINFLRFVDWPPERVPSLDQPYVLAVLNDGSLERAVQAAAARQVIDGRKIAVRGVSSIDEAVQAHLVFIGAAEERRLGSLVQQLSALHVLTVGDTPGYGQAGVMLNLFVANQRVQFEANTAAASRAGIKLRSGLLRLARIVG
jgi:hypothetical protein